MKYKHTINTINVTKTNFSTGTLSILASFKDTEEGSKEAEAYFISAAKAEAKSAGGDFEFDLDLVEDMLDNGYFELGSTTIFLSSSINEEDMEEVAKL